MNGLILMNPAQISAMSPVYSWGLEVIRAIQIFKSPGLTSFMQFASSLGSQYFYIVIILFIFWCVNEKNGFSLGILIIVSAWINAALKVLFNQPRPNEFEPALALVFEPSRGFPSGHAQMSMTFWGMIALFLAYRFARGKKYRPLIFSLAGFIILLVGFSRLYLGVHFPTDIFGGWVFALIILGLFILLHKKACSLFLKGGKRLQLISAAAISLIMNALYPQDTSLSGLFLGFCAGYSLMIGSFRFTAASPAGKGPRPVMLGLRFILGLAIAAVIFMGLKYILPGNDSYFAGVKFLDYFDNLAYFIRYGLVGLWASAGAPGIFRNFGLAGSDDPPVQISE
ncbi:MAG: phosphatase PAP2 family protein [Treponema sp.]|nr:phosphatase PAP2 family protein [Treponema sp.]